MEWIGATYGVLMHMGYPLDLQVSGATGAKQWVGQIGWELLMLHTQEPASWSRWHGGVLRCVLFLVFFSHDLGQEKDKLIVVEVT